jgi:hypothetical protein
MLLLPGGGQRHRREQRQQRDRAKSQFHLST